MKVSLNTTVVAIEEKTSKNGNRYLQFAVMDGTEVLQCVHYIDGSKMVVNGAIKTPDLYKPITFDLDVRIGKYTKVEVLAWKNCQ